MPCRAVPRWRWQQAVTTSEPSDASNCDVVVPYNKRLRHTRKHPNAMYHISYFLDSMVSVAWQQCAVFSRLDSTVVNQMTAAADTSIPCPLLRRPFLRINYGRYVRTYVLLHTGNPVVVVVVVVVDLCYLLLVLFYNC